MTVEQLKQHAEKNKKRGFREMKPGQLTLIRLPLKVGDSKKIYSELAPRGAKNRVFYTGDVTSSSEDSVKTLKNPWVGCVIDTLPRKNIGFRMLDLKNSVSTFLKSEYGP